MSRIKTLADIHNVVLELQYKSSDIELSFYPTFEVDVDTYNKLQNELNNITGLYVGKLFQPDHSYFTYMYMGTKCIVKPIFAEYKTIESTT